MLELLSPPPPLVVDTPFCSLIFCFQVFIMRNLLTLFFIIFFFLFSIFVYVPACCSCVFLGCLFLLFYCCCTTIMHKSKVWRVTLKVYIVAVSVAAGTTVQRATRASTAVGLRGAALWRRARAEVKWVCESRRAHLPHPHPLPLSSLPPADNLVRRLSFWLTRCPLLAAAVANTKLTSSFTVPERRSLLLLLLLLTRSPLR